MHKPCFSRTNSTLKRLPSCRTGKGSRSHKAIERLFCLDPKLNVKPGQASVPNCSKLRGHVFCAVETLQLALSQTGLWGAGGYLLGLRWGGKANGSTQLHYSVSGASKPFPQQTADRTQQPSTLLAATRITNQPCCVNARANRGRAPRVLQPAKRGVLKC